MLFRPVRICISFIGITLLLTGLSVGAEVFFDVSTGGGALAAIPPMLAAMIEGQSFAARTGERPLKSDIWRAVLRMTGVLIVLTLIQASLLYVIAPTAFEVLGLLSAGIWIALIVGVILFNMLMLRLGYGVGLRSELKQKTTAA